MSEVISILSCLVGQKHNIKVANIGEVQILRMATTNQNYIHIEIKSRIHLGNAYDYSVHDLLFSIFLSKNLRLKYTEILFYLLVSMGVKLGISP
jgi:hypothetical protein